MADLPRLAVLFAPRGSATLRDLLRACDAVAEPVIVLPPDCPTALVRMAERLFPLVVSWPDGSPPEFQADAVVTFHDAQLERAAALAEALGTPRPEAAALADKLHQRRVLRAAGLSRIDALAVESPNDLDRAVSLFGYPCVLKPRRGSGGERVTILRGPADHPKDAGLHGLLAEQFIPDARHPGGGWLADYVSVETASTAEGKHHVLATFGKLPVSSDPGGGIRTTGDVLPHGLSAECAARVRDHVLDCLDALGLRQSLSHTEVKLSADAPEVIEVNCRLGGHLSRLTSRRNGTDLVRLAVLAALGEDLDDLARRPPDRSDALDPKDPLHRSDPLDPSDPRDPSGGPAVAGVFVPFGAPGVVRSEVSAAAVRQLPGVCSVDELARPGDDRRSTGGAAANVVLQAPDLARLQPVLAGFLTGLSELFAADGLGESPWVRHLADRLECRHAR